MGAGWLLMGGVSPLELLKMFWNQMNMVVVQYCECTKYMESFTLKWLILCFVNFIFYFLKFQARGGKEVSRVNCALNLSQRNQASERLSNLPKATQEVGG